MAQVCAVRGLLPGQRANRTAIIFAYPPKQLPRARRPLGNCSGWKPNASAHAEVGSVLGYANDDVSRAARPAPPNRLATANCTP